jgi:hypothetical protein
VRGRIPRHRKSSVNCSQSTRPYEDNYETYTKQQQSLTRWTNKKRGIAREVDSTVEVEAHIQRMEEDMADVGLPRKDSIRARSNWKEQWSKTSETGRVCKHLLKQYLEQRRHKMDTVVLMR